MENVTVSCFKDTFPWFLGWLNIEKCKPLGPFFLCSFLFISFCYYSLAFASVKVMLCCKCLPQSLHWITTLKNKQILEAFDPFIIKFVELFFHGFHFCLDSSTSGWTYLEVKFHLCFPFVLFVVSFITVTSQIHLGLIWGFGLSRRNSA